MGVARAPSAGLKLGQRAEALASALPPLLVRSEKIAATVILGSHGRKTAGSGETFWQYRPYSFGDSTARVDWHRSARADGVYIRENEWESANTLWIWSNTGPRMDFRSHLAATTKRDRALMIALGMASLAVRGHERIGVIGSPQGAGHGKAALVKAADWLSQHETTNLPQALPRQRRAAAVLVSDFLDPLDETRSAMTALAGAGVNGHLVQIADPAEETLPFDGRIEFIGMDIKTSYLSPKTETLRDSYAKAYADHRAGLGELARRLGWSLTIHRTTDSAAACLLSLHLKVAGERNAARGRGMGVKAS